MTSCPRVPGRALRAVLGTALGTALLCGCTGAATGTATGTADATATAGATTSAGTPATTGTATGATGATGTGTATATAATSAAAVTATTAEASATGTTTASAASSSEADAVAQLRQEAGSASRVVRLGRGTTDPARGRATVAVGDTLRLVLVPSAAGRVRCDALGVDVRLTRGRPAPADLLPTEAGTFTVTFTPTGGNARTVYTLVAS